MRQTDSLVEKAIGRILELSADLQIKRRAFRNGSPAFRDLSAAIAAYGDALEVLTTLQQQDQYSSSFGLHGSLDSSPEPRAIF
jgi:hypothetical protein